MCLHEDMQQNTTYIHTYGYPLILHSVQAYHPHLFLHFKGACEAPAARWMLVWLTVACAAACVWEHKQELMW